MIISTRNSYLFLKTTKTAGTSFEIALSRYAAPGDVITPISDEDEETRAALGHPGPQNHLKPPGLLQRLGLRRPEAKFYNHIPAAEVANLIGPEAFNRLFKVAIVRNPYDLALSRYYWSHRRQGGTSAEHFRQWLLSRPAVLTKNHSITRINGKSVVDMMIRFEHFRDDISAFASRVGLPDTLFTEFDAIRAKGQYRPKRAKAAEMFAGFDQGKAVIAELFADDIATYGYSCP